MSGIAATNPAEAGIHGIGPAKLADTPLPPHKDAPTSLQRSEFVAAVRAVAEEISDGGTFGGNPGRFVVGGQALSITLPPGTAGPAAMAAALAYVAMVTEVIDAGFGLGVWRDPRSRRIYLDVVYATDSLNVARIIATEEGELAFYDRETASAISTSLVDNV